MNRLAVFVLLAILGLAVITAAGPTLVLLMRAAVPLVIAVGVMAIVLRVLWHFTHRW
jgi:hypothetical protein